MGNCIDRDELHRIQRIGQTTIIVDVRTLEEYELQHIPTALNVPLDELKEYTKNLHSDYLIITVCGKGGGRSETAAMQLRENGFNAQFLCGGTFGWFEIS